MFTEQMASICISKDARSLTYSEFPIHWVWNSRNKVWTRGKQGRCIGRIPYIHRNAGELYY